MEALAAALISDLYILSVGLASQREGRSAPLSHLLSGSPHREGTPPGTELAPVQAGEHCVFKQTGLQEVPSIFAARLHIPAESTHLAPGSPLAGSPSSALWQPF